MLFYINFIEYYLVTDNYYPIRVSLFSFNHQKNKKIPDKYFENLNLRKVSGGR